MVAGFAAAAPNAALIDFAARQLSRGGSGALLDIGCGAGRNAVPLARLGWRVAGTDASQPMLRAAAAGEGGHRLRLANAEMADLPIQSASVDFIVAHGIWNLARSGTEFRGAVREAARVARPGASVFVFTFSRHTLPAEATPVAGETFVFTQFSGAPQCFLTEAQRWTNWAPPASNRISRCPSVNSTDRRQGCARAARSFTKALFDL